MQHIIANNATPFLNILTRPCYQSYCYYLQSDLITLYTCFKLHDISKCDNFETFAYCKIISVNFEIGVSLSLKYIGKVSFDCTTLQKRECIHSIQKAGQVNLTIF